MAQIDAWIEHKKIQVKRCLRVLTDLSRVTKPDLAMLSVAMREIRNLLEISYQLSVITCKFCFKGQPTTNNLSTEA
ncbi:MAG: hypothetical protein ABFS56_23930 [Pseudomonadota bacterium]